MSDQNWERIESILDEALSLPENQRDEFVIYKCEGDDDLKSEITQLLNSISDSEGWLEEPDRYKVDFYREIVNDSDTFLPGSSLIGQQVGAYQIKELLGEGGMGLVYLAERTDGTFDHQVALKVIREGMDTEQNIRRFQQEQRILAGLSHPNIAGILDGGVTDSGLPYLIMEYVDGTPIDTYCEENKLSVHERLELIKTICSVVQYAHNNLIIHRDLKPENILVDKQGHIRILDFGIAKLLDPDHSDALGVRTRTGARILTFGYAAPEQIQGQAITTAVDSYALGILMYKLLTGVLPLDKKGKTVSEIQRLIIKEPPPKPSERFKSLGPQQQKELGRQRQSTPQKLVQTLQDDLDAIILKNLRKEPAARYNSPDQLLEDIERYENRLPVSAREGKVRYHVSKFIKRHKLGITTATAVMLMTLGFVVFYTYQIALERNRARVEAAKAKQVKNFMLEIFTSSNPDMVSYSGKNITAFQLLTAGINKTEEELRNSPELYIEMLTAIGSALKNIDEFNASKNALHKALDKSNNYYGFQSTQSAGILATMADLESEKGNYYDSEKLISKAITIDENNKEKSNPALADHYSILGFTKALQGEYREADKILLKADSLYIASGKSKSTRRFTNMSNLAEVKSRIGQYEQAERYLLESLDFYKKSYNGPHLNIATNQGKLGSLYQTLGKYEKAEELLLEALSLKIELLGEQSSSVANTYGTLAINSRTTGNFIKAEEFAQKQNDIHHILYADTSVKIAESLNNLALVKSDKEDYTTAEQLYRKALSIKKLHLDENHPSLAIALYNLAHVLYKQKKYVQSTNLLKQVIEIDKRRLGPDHREVAVDLNKLGSVFRDMGALAKADSTFREAKQIFLSKFPENHYRLADYFLEYGLLKLDQNNRQEGIKMLERALFIYKENFEESHHKIKKVQKILAEY